MKLVILKLIPINSNGLEIHVKQAKYIIFAQFTVFYRLVEFSTRSITFLSHVFLTEISIMPFIFALVPVTGVQRDP